MDKRDIIIEELRMTLVSEVGGYAAHFTNKFIWTLKFSKEMQR
jgi:hypothetical protein